MRQVILDTETTGLDPKYELAVEIRKENSQIPVVALTADAFPEREQECLSAGMNDRIVKPVNLQNLEKILQRYIQ